MVLMRLHDVLEKAQERRCRAGCGLHVWCQCDGGASLVAEFGTNICVELTSVLVNGS